MKQKNLFLMVGVPGSGKSTWIQQRFNPETDAWCSRDKVRFSLVAEDEEYFSKETLVVKTWHEEIRQAIRNDKIKNIYIDATHTTKSARTKVLNALRADLKNCDVIAVVLNTPLATCIHQNEQRQGREVVPRSAIHRMNTFFVYPSKTEYNYKDIIFVKKGEK